MSTSERDKVIHEHDAKVKLGVPFHVTIEENIKEILTAEHEKERYAARHRHRKAMQLHQKNKDEFSALKRTKHKVKSYFWDYNTVEATMLACAIFVCLAGVMFESGQFDTSTNHWQFELMSYLTMLVVVFSFVYYFAVFCSEVCGRNVFARCFASKKTDEDKSKEMDAGVEFANPMSRVGSQGNMADPTGINPLVMAKLAGLDSGTASRSADDWAMIRNELERMQTVNKKLHRELKDLKKKLENAELGGGGGGGARHKARKAGRKKKEFGGGILGHKGGLAKHSSSSASGVLKSLGRKLSVHRPHIHGTKKAAAHPEHGRAMTVTVKEAITVQNPMAGNAEGGIIPAHHHANFHRDEAGSAVKT